MKKWMSSLLVVFLFVSLAACGKTDLAEKVREKRPEEFLETDSGTDSETDSETDSGMDSETERVSEEVSVNARKDYKEGVIDASEIIVCKGVVFWGCEGHLCSALLDGQGKLYDFISEGSLSAEIYSLALEDSTIYMATDLGIIGLPLEEHEREQSNASVINDHKLSNSSFQIYNDYIYFTYGRSLYRVSKQGGEEEKLEKEVEEFQVTTEGIYCLDTDGDLICVSFDGTERKTLYELNSSGDLVFYQDKAYITTGEADDYIYEYDTQADAIRKIYFENTLSQYDPVWVTEEAVYYDSEHYETFRYDKNSGKEIPTGTQYSLPDYRQGYLENDVLCYVLADTLFWMNLETGESNKIDKKMAVKGDQAKSQTKEEPVTDIPDTSGSYNIAEDIGIFNSEGQARLESRYFTLYLPADGDWNYRVLNNTTVQIYYEPSYNAGNGGDLVTIQAYDWEDNSYADLPDYTIAGLSNDKKYIAIFPTDVQFGPDEEKGYRRMLEYVQRIDNTEAKADNNPFYCQ